MEAMLGDICEDNYLSVGPWGDAVNGARWDDGVFSGVRQAVITYGNEGVYHIQIEYDNNGNSVWSYKHGEFRGPKRKEIKFDFPHEDLISIGGSYGIAKKDAKNQIVRSIMFESSLKTYGPYGCTKGDIPIILPVTGGKIVGFHGRSSFYLNSIGVHFSPFLTRNPSMHIPDGGSATPLQQLKEIVYSDPPDHKRTHKNPQSGRPPRKLPPKNTRYEEEDPIPAEKSWFRHIPVIATTNEKNKTIDGMKTTEGHRLRMVVKEPAGT